MVAVFERQSGSGWVYPCTVGDICLRLALFSPEELAGLWAIGLVPYSRDHPDAYGIYYWEHRYSRKPTIHIPAWRECLSLKQGPHTSRGQVYAFYAVELAYGMQVEQSNDRWVCRWRPETLRAFILGHVLPHEIGHHVCHTQRLRQGLTACPGEAACEQFAEDYALRLQRELPRLKRVASRRACCHKWPHADRRPRLPQQGCRLYPAQGGNMRSSCRASRTI